MITRPQCIPWLVISVRRNVHIDKGKTMVNVKNACTGSSDQVTEIRLNCGAVICTVADDPCSIAIKFRHPDGTETRIAGISQMDPRAWGPVTFRVYISDGENYYTESRIVTIVPAQTRD